MRRTRMQQPPYLYVVELGVRYGRSEHLSLLDRCRLGILRYVARPTCEFCLCFFFQAEDGIRDLTVTGVQTCALPIWAGDFELAEQLAGEAAAAYPTHAVLLNNLAVLKELAGDLEAAEELVRTARKNEPSLPQLSKNLADLAYRGSRYDEAWDAYSRAVGVAPDLGDEVDLYLGQIAYRPNDQE